jgi:putative peptide maturation dehydrogenase
LTRVRRTRYVAFACADSPGLDVVRLLQGEIELVRTPGVFAFSALTAGRYALSAEELDLVVAVPEEWTATSTVLDGRPAGDVERLNQLADKGVIVTDEAAADRAELRRRDEILTDEQWDPRAALYHVTTKWRDVHVDLGPQPEPGESFDDLVARATAQLDRLGKPPPHFASLRESAAVSSLPRVERDGGLYDALMRRRTARSFDQQRRLTREQLATVLHYVWGCHGLSTLSEDVALVKKTSPSGGGLHPIEVYPLVRDVDGVEPGLYHYEVSGHALELVAPLARADVEELIVEFTAGQAYFCGAHVVFLMTARFHRSFWKYRQNPRAYAVVLMDAAHLSQTLYLVCTELGLGAFVTAAINAGNIEERLGLDGFSEGAVLVCGCGPEGPRAPGLEPVFEPNLSTRS